MADTINAERDRWGFFKEPFETFVLDHVGDFTEETLQRFIVEAIASLDDCESEPCYKCGHAFADHQFAGDGGETKCELCTRHAFKSFPKGWGKE